MGPQNSSQNFNEISSCTFSGEENFPVGEYGDPSMVAILREIGLQDVEPEDLWETAHQIQDALERVSHR